MGDLIEPVSDNMSEEKEFEYSIWAKERLLTVTKLNFFIITAVAAVAPFIVQNTDVTVSQLTDGWSMILGISIWMATLSLIILVSFMIKPASVLDSSPTDLHESYRQLAPAHETSTDWGLISNLIDIIIATTIISGTLLFMAVLEAWSRNIYNQNTFIAIVFVAVILISSILPVIYMITIHITSIPNIYRTLKYFVLIYFHKILIKLLSRFGRQSIYVGDLGIQKYLILECLNEGTTKSIENISMSIEHDYNRVLQHVGYLYRKGLITEAQPDQYSLTRKGYTALQLHTADEL